VNLYRENLRLDIESELSRISMLLTATVRSRDLLRSSQLMRERDRLVRQLQYLESVGRRDGGESCDLEA